VGVLRPVQLRVGDDARVLELVLAPAGELCVELATEAPAGLRVGLEWNGTRVSEAALAPGGRLCERLPPGRVAVLLWQCDGAEPVLVEEAGAVLWAGATTELELKAAAERGPQEATAQLRGGKGRSQPAQPARKRSISPARSSASASPSSSRRLR
jgi:hypothetical protein